MRIWAALSGIAFLGAAAAMAATSGASPTQEAAIRKYWNGCPFRDERLPAPPGQRRPDTTRQLSAMFRDGPGNPLGDARRAADEGDFRLFWSSSLIGQAVLGAACRFPQNHPVDWPTPFTRGTLTVSDVVGECETRPNGCEIDRRFGRYASAYNRAIIADPRFPYADLCTAETTAYRRQPSLADLAGLAAPSASQTDRPRTLAEAARHGTQQALSGWLARTSSSELDRQDDFALTPLAWAAIEGRTEAARMLIAKGADPLAGCAPVRGRADTLPLKIALQLGRKDIVALMLRPDVEQRLSPWPAPIIEAAVQGDQADLVKRMLREDHQTVYMTGLMFHAQKRSSASMIAVLGGAQPDSANAMLSVAIARGDVPLLRQALAMKPQLIMPGEARSSPLGDAARSSSVAIDQMVALLLEHGAPPDSPAQWTGSYPTGSSPATALGALVVHAIRFRDGRAGVRADEIVVAQERALQLLLKAGASTKVGDERGRPLVILAVLGRFDGQTRDEPPPGWITRLADAGMDVNATWQGKTALDWLNEMNMKGSSASAELARAGGKTSGGLKALSLAESIGIAGLIFSIVPAGALAWNRSRSANR